ncbi:MAG: hypothetical protein WA702_01600, partial [Bradyrhizobium sp.]
MTGSSPFCNPFAQRKQVFHDVVRWKNLEELMMAQPRSDATASLARGAARAQGRVQGKVALVFGAGSSGPGWGNGKAAAVLYAR